MGKNDEPERRLIAAVLLKAIYEAIGIGSNLSVTIIHEARMWLLSSEAFMYAQLIGIENVWPPTEQQLIDLKKSGKRFYTP